MRGTCEPAGRAAETPGWHWLADEDGHLFPSHWRRWSTKERGPLWVWHYGNRYLSGEIMAAMGHTYRGKAVMPAEATALKTGVLEAIDALEFNRSDPVERRSPSQYAAHLLRLALEQGGLGR